MAKKSADYKAKMKQIRSYVSFNYDLRKPLTAGQKARITKYHNYLMGSIAPDSPSTYVYRPRDKKTLRTVQKAVGTPPGFGALKVAFVPTLSDSVKSMRYNKKSGTFVVTSLYGQSVYIPLDPERMIGANAAQYIDQAINRHKKFPRYVIQYGEWDSPAMSREFITEEIVKLAERYNVPGNHNYKNWLMGITAINITNQADRDKYLDARHAAALEKTRARRKATKRKN